MSKAAWSGPHVVYGDRHNPAQGGSSNPDQGPGAFLGGNGLLDYRVNYNVTVKGWIGQGVNFFRCFSATPAALGTAKFAALANVVNGTAMALAVASTGITVLAAALTLPNSAVIPAGCLVVDGNPSVMNYGLADPNGLYNNKVWNNSSLTARAVSITGVAGGAGGNIDIAGYDTYGVAMTERIAATAGATTANGKKAFKFIASITPRFTDAHNYSVGTTDIFGFPIRAGVFDETMLWYNSALLTASTGFVVADATAATNATGDVRGTYAVQSASDGVKRLSFAVSPGQNTLAGTLVWGVPQA